MSTSLQEYVRKVCELEQYLHTENVLLSFLTEELKKYQRLYQTPPIDTSSIDSKYHYLPVIEYNSKPAWFTDKMPRKPISMFVFLGIWLISFVAFISAVALYGEDSEAFFSVGMVYLLSTIMLIVSYFTKEQRKAKYEEALKLYNDSKSYIIECERSKINEKRNSELSKLHEEELSNAIMAYRKKIFGLISTLQNQKTETESERNKIAQKLEAMYAENIIYPKYRSIIPMFMFQEYLDSKRCDTLEGHEGAYNIYEQEIRANVIISQLDSVLSELEDIRSNQYSLYAALNDSIHSTNRIMTSMQSQIAGYMEQNSNQMEVNQALLEYNNKVSTHILDLMYWGKPY